ncbi:MAG: alpha-L-fucosidase [Bacteroidales bacterium]|nr:alpha-L-fucosidase [Bacteroidales bacterium]MCF8392200.1 alpha-L-fucosidase [Bacteroidales bacterium]
MRIFTITLLLALTFSLTAQNYTPDWESLDTRPIPEWYSDAKFGIFVHWGLFSVPAYRPYAEDEYGYKLKDNTYAAYYIPEVMYQPGVKTNFHKIAYGENFSYFDFVNQFKAELFNPEDWAKLFKSTGAQYIVMTAKPGDGYALWPSQERYSKGWNSGETGPHRDLVGEMSNAVKATGMQMGLYYSFTEFWTTKTNTWPAEATLRNGYYVPREVWEKYSISDSDYTERIHFQTKELINNYQPDILWTDGELDYNGKDLKSKELLAWIYNEAPNKEWIVVNDRWERGSRGNHGGFVSLGYGDIAESIAKNKKKEVSIPMAYSYGYNRAEAFSDYKSSDEIIKTMVKTIAKGDNFLLGVGAKADGSLPMVTEQKLEEISKWMVKNREAILDADSYTPEVPFWTINPKAGENILFTRNGKNIYLILTDWTTDLVNLKNFKIGDYSIASSVDTGEELDIDFNKTSFVITLPKDRNKKVYIVRIESIDVKVKKEKVKKEKKSKPEYVPQSRGQGKGNGGGKGSGMGGGRGGMSGGF